MLKMRLQRVGRKHDPSYRVVITEHTEGPKSGKSLEVVGSYDARTDRKEVNEERVKYWLGVGVQPSGTVHNILIDKGILKDKKVNVLPKRKPKEEAEESADSKEAPQAVESGDQEGESQEKEEKEPEAAEENKAEEAPKEESKDAEPEDKADPEVKKEIKKEE